VATLLNGLVEELLVSVPRGDLGSQRVDQRAFRRRQLGGAVDGEDPDLVRFVADGGDDVTSPGALTYVAGSAGPISVWTAWYRPLSEL
jgi:hypothetical protein